MNVEYHNWYSHRLGQEMALKVYGHYGKPMMVFPSSEGRFFDYENFTMIGTLAGLIEAGRLKVFAVDSIDPQTWFNPEVPFSARGPRYDAYQGYVMEEVIPFLREHCQNPAIKVLGHGCSFGAFHTANFALKHPDIFNSALCLSGVYSLNFSVGEYCDDGIYFNDPLKYVPGLRDERYLAPLRENRIILCNGRGAWEEWSLNETLRLSQALNQAGVPHWCDIWGGDAAHDWPWWKQQILYFLERLGV